MEAFLIHIGVDPASVFAAFTGGVCAAFATQGSRPTLIGLLSSVIVGTGVGSYGGPVIPAYLGLKPSGFATFADNPLASAKIAEGKLKAIADAARQLREKYRV